MATVVADPYAGLSYDDKQRWVCVYPAYLNSRKTVAEGRRVSKQQAVDNPLCSEIKDVCVSQQLNAEIENKHYPRELARDHIHSGRVRVQMRNADGSFLNDNLTTRKQLLAMLAETIPKLKSRQSGKSGGGGSAESSQGATSSGKKKKGKRK